MTGEERRSPALTLIDARIEELAREAERILAPYNAAIGELRRLKEQLEKHGGVPDENVPATP